MMKTAAEAFLSETSLFLICGALLVLLLVLAALMVWQRISGHRKISELDDQLEETEKKMRTLEEAYEKEREYREQLQAQSEQEKRAGTVDSLTNLPNYRAFTEWVDNVTATIRKEEKVAILHVDLDDFKKINDELGHAYGDELLIDVTHRLLQAVDENDVLARTEGDDFMMVTQNISDIDDYEEKVKKIQTVLSYPFLLAGREFVITASMGICFAPRDGINTRTLLRNADLAMQNAKKLGKNRYCYYSEELEEESTSSMEQQAKLRTAVADNELEVWYEPVTDPFDGSVQGFGAAVRWNNPEEGILDFTAYEELAENTNLSVQIGDWLLDTVCAQMSRWKKQGKLMPVSLPLYYKQMKEEGFIQKLEQKLEEYGISGEKLIYEVREETILPEAETISGILRELRERGIRICLCQYGEGYGSLNLLRQIPAHIVRLSHFLIREGLEQEEGAELLKAMTSVIRALRMELAAERIEDPEEEELLRQLNCHRARGLLYGELLPGDKIVL